MDNDFNKISKEERERAQATQLSAIFEMFKTLDERIATAVRKEVRAVREDLRNMDKLRPLRSKDEAESSEEQPVGSPNDTKSEQEVEQPK